MARDAALMFPACSSCSRPPVFAELIPQSLRLCLGGNPLAAEPVPVHGGGFCLEAVLLWAHVRYTLQPGRPLLHGTAQLPGGGGGPERVQPHAKPHRASFPLTSDAN